MKRKAKTYKFDERTKSENGHRIGVISAVCGEESAVGRQRSVKAVANSGGATDGNTALVTMMMMMCEM